MMKLAQIRNRPCEVDDVTRAACIYTHRDLLRYGEIVNRREMKNARGFLLDQFEIYVTQGQVRLTDITFHDLKVTGAAAAELSDALDFFERVRHERPLNEQDKIAVLAREAFQQAVGNET